MEKERKSCMLKRKHYKEDIKKICNLFLTLLLLLVGAETTNAAVETFDFTKMFSYSKELDEVKGTNINITFNTTTSTKLVPNWNSSYSSVVVYKNVNSFNIATNHSNYLIWQIVITFRNKENHFIMSSGNEATGDNGKYSSKDNVTTWSGASNSVTFTNKENNTWWIQKIEVSYSIGGNGREESNPYTVGDINTFFYINRPPKEQRYIKGIVSKVGKYDSSAGTISYHLSDNGIDKDAIVVQEGKGLKGVNITNQHQIARGDTLTVYGHAEEVGDSLVLQSTSLTSMETYKDQVTIKAAGWATYVSHRPIDFSKTEGIQAFQTKYEAASNTIVLSPVEAIPENTAVVLKGDPGSYTFTNVASADPLNDNELTFYTTDTPVTEERTVYVLSMKEGVCGFFPYAKGKSMPSYKGCLLIKKNTAAKPFYRVDAKTPTDIRSIKQLQSQAVRYNLAGERVSNRYKGIVIENGRKIIVK